MIELDKKQLADVDYRSKEAFKTLRTNILFCGDDVKVISMTSATPNEGKSSVSLNLAVSLADMGKKVIYIDADLRKSVVKQKHRIKGVKVGFSHFLSGMKKFDEVVCSTNVPNLHMVLAGPVPPNPSELICSASFVDLIKGLYNEYDYIIFDTPPIGVVTDALLLKDLIAGFVLVVRERSTTHGDLQKLLDSIKLADSKALGVLSVGCIRSNKKSKKGYYYYQYY
jgi:capsular exopolysaccharide synthesis family protein